MNFSKTQSLAIPSRSNASQFNNQDDEILPYISEVNKISITKEIFKKQTKLYVNKLGDVLEKKKNRKLHEVKKLQLFVDYDKSLLEQLNNRRSSYGKMMKEFLEVTKKIFKNQRLKREAKQIFQTEKSIRDLLSEASQPQDQPSNLNQLYSFNKKVSMFN